MTHRKGRGWRGGFLGSAMEQYLKLDLTKWLKVLRHLELLPRPLGQDWSEIWLQNFSGTITIWPRSSAKDFWYILSDPSPERLARIIQIGQSATFPKLLFVANRMKVERLIEHGLLLGRSEDGRPSSIYLKRQEVIIGPKARAEGLEYNHLYDGMELVNRLQTNIERRSSSVMEELRRQGGVFFDDSDEEGEDMSGGSATGDDTGKAIESSATRRNKRP